MPLADYLPQLDNRRYDDIMAEVRTRIPRYTPEWTDFNDSDPGMALIQLFAWLTDLLLFRLGRVPELNYLKFLQLLGIDLRPAQPAMTEVFFPVLESCREPYVIVPPRTQVAAQGEGGAELVVFETERAITALSAPLAAVLVFAGGAFDDVTQINVDATRGFEPLGPLAAADNALMLGFQSDQEFPALIELSLMVWVSEAASQTAAFDCGLPERDLHPAFDLAWEYWSGGEWRPLSLLKDQSLTFTKSGPIYLKTPAKEEMRRGLFRPAAAPLYWIRARVRQAAAERAPHILALRPNTAAVLQAETVRDEVLGGSDGSPHQCFNLAYAPVIHGSLKLEVDQSDGFQEWTRVGDFFGSKPGDTHYVLNHGTGKLVFGDGVHGAIPVANVDNRTANVVARHYRFGGGRKGNVPAGSLTTLLTTVSGIDENGVTNLRPAHSGREEESLEEAKLRAPREIQSKCRAVTSEDFEHLAMEAANIKRAKALPLFHPQFPGVKVPGVVTVIVVPDSPEDQPLPSEGTLRTVCAYLNQRRLLTTEVYVIRPTYREVSVTVEVIAQNHADLAEVKEAVEQALFRYFHPLRGGEKEQGWPFGGDIFFSLVYRLILSQPGVQRVEKLTISLDGEEAPECTDISIPDGVLLYSKTHEVAVRYDLEV